MVAARDHGINSVLFRNATRRRLGLNTADSECLSFIAIEGQSSPTDIARYTGLTTGSTTAMLDRLEKIGFIRRRPNPGDRRGVLIEINEKYNQAAWPLVAGIQKANADLVAGYTEAELTTLADFLSRFANNLIEQTEIIDGGLS